MATERLLPLPNKHNSHYGSVSNPPSSAYGSSIQSSLQSASTSSRSDAAQSSSQSSSSNISSNDNGHSLARTISKHSRFKGGGTPSDSLKMMERVLRNLLDNNVPGPQLFRLNSEFGMEIGSGSQFRVMATSDTYAAKLKSVADSYPTNPLAPAMRDLMSCVVKRAHWITENEGQEHYQDAGSKDVSSRDLKKELHQQMVFAENEIDKLCNRAYQRHPNIVKLRGWGLCLDTFEALRPLDTRIPLLVLERATCDLGQFVAGPKYDSASYSSLAKICRDIGTGLGGLHQGNVTHGDMKPENILLFFKGGPPESAWTAKLCDFGTAESKPDSPATNHQDDEAPRVRQDSFEYCGTRGWAPPEMLQNLDFQGLKCCDIYVFGLIVWRVFETKRHRSRLKGPIDEEDLPSYRERDTAYRGAAQTIRSCVLIPKPIQDPDLEVRRILAVLRGALQPDPQHRNPRPWRYFNTTYYPTIPKFDEAPGSEPKDGFTLVINSYLVPFSSRQISKIRNGLQDFSAHFQKSIIPMKEMFKGSLSTFSAKPDRQKMFEQLCASLALDLDHSWDVESVDVIRHTGRGCFDLSSFLQRFAECCQGNVNPWAANHLLNSYARLRSRIPLCCWQLALQQSHFDKFNVLHLCLRTPAQEDYNSWQNRALTRGYSLSTIAWLSQGEIGEWELEPVESEDGFLKYQWQWTHQRDMHPEISLQFFQLFMEKGGYVGDTVAWNNGLPVTALRQYLEVITEESSDTSRNSALIRQSCAAILRRAMKILTSKAGPKSSIIPADLLFFYTGQGPDQNVLTGHDEASPSIPDAITTTVLHEAVLSCCYTAVEYFVDYSGIPLTVRDQNSDTALDLAYKLRSSYLKDWQHVHNSLIIGILSKNSVQVERSSMLPLGWKETTFEPGFTAYHEATINPQNPSITFRAPKFSLLRDRRISLGSPTNLGAGPIYQFDLVRFIRKTKKTDEKLATDIFNDRWYRDDILEPHQFFETKSPLTPIPRPQSRVFLLSDIGQFWSWTRDVRIPVRRDGESWISVIPESLMNLAFLFLSLFWSMVFIIIQSLMILRIVLFSNYVSVLLVFLPVSILARNNSWDLWLSFSFSFLALIPLIAIWEFCLHQWTLRAQSNLEESTFSYVGNCFPELCIGIATILNYDSSWIQMSLLGSIMCNQLLIPGICFYAAGINNSRTGWASGIEQSFNATTNDLMAELVSLTSVFSAIFLAMSWGILNGPFVSDPLAGFLLTARVISIISLMTFAAWVFFRFYSHTNLFDLERYDDYDDGEREELTISVMATLAVGVVTLVGIYTQADTLSLSLDPRPLTTQNMIATYLLPFLRITKHVRAVQFAFQDKVDESLALTLGFTVTLTLFLAPSFVIVAWIIGQSSIFAFTTFQVVVFILTARLMTIIIWNGKSNYIEGAKLIAMYTFLALAFYVSAGLI